MSLTGENRHDVTQFIPLLDAVPRLRDRRGRPRHQPRRIFADRGYDYDKYRRLIRKSGITSKIACRGTPHGSGLGKTRCVVERPRVRSIQLAMIDLMVRRLKPAPSRIGPHEVAVVELAFGVPGVQVESAGLVDGGDAVELVAA